MTARVGVFGGTFDPPHRGHVSVATDVADALDLDEVLWVVARRSPHKPVASVAPDDVRLRMVRAATAADPRFRPSAVELDRPAPSYTVDTLRELRGRMDADAELFLIVGIDQYRAFEGWREPDAIRGLATLAVMDRGGQGLDEDRASGDERAVRVPVRRVDISSTRVREAVARGDPIDDLVPAAVARVVEAEGLYPPA